MLTGPGPKLSNSTNSAVVPQAEAGHGIYSLISTLPCEKEGFLTINNSEEIRTILTKSDIGFFIGLGYYTNIQKEQAKYNDKSLILMILMV